MIGVLFMISNVTVGYTEVDVGLAVVDSVGPCGVLLLDRSSEGVEGITSTDRIDAGVEVVG